MKKILSIVALFFSLTSLSYASINDTVTSPKAIQPITVMIESWNIQHSNIKHKTLLNGVITLSDGAVLSELQNQTYLAAIHKTCQNYVTSSLHMNYFFDQPASTYSVPSVDTKPTCISKMIPATITTGYQFVITKVVDNKIYFKFIMSELLSMNTINEPSIGNIQDPKIYQKTVEGIMPYQNNSWYYTFQSNNSSKKQEFDISITKN